MPCPRKKMVLFCVCLALVVLPGSHCNPRVKLPPDIRPTATAAPAGTSSGIVVPPGTPHVHWSSTSNPIPDWSSILRLIINNHRHSLGLGKLKWHDGLGAVSQWWSTHTLGPTHLSIVSTKGFDVYQVMVNATPPMTYTDAFAVVYNTNGNSQQAVFNALYKLKSVRAVIDDPNYTHMGSFNNSNMETLIFAQNVVP